MARNPANGSDGWPDTLPRRYKGATMPASFKYARRSPDPEIRRFYGEGTLIIFTTIVRNCIYYKPGYGTLPKTQV